MVFKDHFSAHANSYAKSRPDYPQALFDRIAGLCTEHKLAWDCATGNGQAAASLANYFQTVVATDASAAQLAAAPVLERVSYQQANAEQTCLEAESVDLIFVGQALHWFDIDAFFSNVHQTLKPNGMLVVSSYSLLTIGPEVDRLMQTLYRDILGDYWPAERQMVDAAYRDVEFPYKSIALPSFEMAKLWTLSEVIDYLRTWSALQRYVKQHNEDPLLLIVEQLRLAWGIEDKRLVKWPLTVIAGRK